MSKGEFASLEELEERRRWPRAIAQIKSLVDHVKEIRLEQNPEPLPEDLVPVDKERLFAGLLQALKETTPEDVSDSVARRMARKIGDYFLWRREPTVPVIHELLVLAPWWIANMPGEVFARLRDIGLAYTFNGQVVPIQMVWRDLLDAPAVYMGHCTCRSAKVVQDLPTDSENMKLFVSAEQERRLLDRLVDRYEVLKQKGEGDRTDAPFSDIFEQLSAVRKKNVDDYRIQTLLKGTYPFWEFLPLLEKYTPTWVRSLHTNRKARQIHALLAVELANIFYLARGVLFSSMRLVEQPYCICSCPTPEVGGGCVLTNWYYQGRSETSLLMNEEHHGRRRDEQGKLQPCAHFPIRSTRDCLGCGCSHEKDEGRSVETILAEADELLAQRKIL